MAVSLEKFDDKGNYIPRKQQIALNILSEARRLHVREMLEGMWEFDANNNIVVQGENLPGYTEDDITPEDIMQVATASADFEMWWCRAAATQVGISIPYMDWAWYNLTDTLDLADEMVK